MNLRAVALHCLLDLGREEGWEGGMMGGGEGGGWEGQREGGRNGGSGRREVREGDWLKNGNYCDVALCPSFRSS